MAIEIHRPVVNDFGGAPFAEHDQACAVCQVNKAVYLLNSGRFEPCWECQAYEGWRLKKVHRLNCTLRFKRHVWGKPWDPGAGRTWHTCARCGVKRVHRIYDPSWLNIPG